jgi:hypothetical protein
MGGLALSSLYRREIEHRVNDTICENAYCNISLMGGAGPGDDRKKSHHFRDLQQGKGALRHQESFPILVEATYLAPLAIFFFRDEFAADSPLQRRVHCEPHMAADFDPGHLSRRATGHSTQGRSLHRDVRVARSPVKSGIGGVMWLAPNEIQSLAQQAFPEP